MRLHRAVALALLLLAPSRAHAEEDPPARSVSGTIAKDSVWSGRIRLAGDVVVKAGATLRIEAGTRILAEKLPMPRGPSSAHDLSVPFAEIHVLGRVLALGKDTAPILFGNEPEWVVRKEDDPPLLTPVWLGVVLHPEPMEKSRFLHCRFRGALGGVQCAGGSPEFEDCVFLECSIGLGSGTAFGDRLGRRHVRGLLSAPVVRRCRFGGCDTALYVDRDSRPSVERCVFLDNTVGIGRWRRGITYPIQGLGPLVARCDFLMNDVACQGSGSVRDSIFLLNGLVFASSAFHYRYSAVIDRYHRSHNVYSANRSLRNDDIPLGEVASLKDPGYKGPIEKDRRLVLSADLEKILSLPPGSPVRRSASDGGDPGSFGAVGASRGGGGRGVEEPGRAVTLWLAPGPPGRYGDDEIATAKKAIRHPSGGPAPGGRLGRAVWGLFPAEEGRWIPPPELVRAGERAVLLASVDAEAEGHARLLIGVDGLLLEAFWNDRALPVPVNPRRFDPSDLDHAVKLRRGRNHLLLRVNLASPRPRVSARIEGGPAWSAPWAPPEGEPGALITKIAAAAARGRRPGRLTIYLTGPAHWPDVVRAPVWRLTDGDGAEVVIPADGIEYDPGMSKVVLPGLPLVRGMTYRLETAGLRDVWGREAKAREKPLAATAR